MKKYIINPEYVTSRNENSNILFSSDMECVYVLKEVESIIVNTFLDPLSMNDAVEKLRTYFSIESFNAEECIEFINLLIEEKIIKDAQN